MRQCRHVRATIRGSASGGHDTCFNVFITRFICGSWLTCRIDTSLAPALGWPSRGLYTGIKAYFRRADVSGSRSRATCETWRTSVVARSLFVFSYLDSARAETRDSREWSLERRRRLSPGHISVCNYLDMVCNYPDMSKTASPLCPALCFLTHENTRVSICTAQNEVPCCPELMTARQSERGFSRP